MIFSSLGASGGKKTKERERKITKSRRKRKEQRERQKETNKERESFFSAKMRTFNEKVITSLTPVAGVAFILTKNSMSIFVFGARGWSSVL